MKPVDSQISGEMLKIECWSHCKMDYSKTGSYSNYFVDPHHIVSSAQIIKDNEYILEGISGVDVLEGILLVYHFDRLDRSQRITLRTIIPNDPKKVPSIVSVYSGADWHERECFDFFGVIFENHPNLKPLLLPDDLNIHPLIKESGRKSCYTLLPFGMLVDENRS